jgi:hypothetical protein
MISIYRVQVLMIIAVDEAFAVLEQAFSGLGELRLFSGEVQNQRRSATRMR